MQKFGPNRKDVFNPDLPSLGWAIEMVQRIIAPLTITSDQPAKKLPFEEVNSNTGMPINKKKSTVVVYQNIKDTAKNTALRLSKDLTP